LWLSDQIKYVDGKAEVVDIIQLAISRKAALTELNIFDPSGLQSVAGTVNGEITGEYK